MKYAFNGSLDDDQYDTQSLVALVQMIIGGTNIQNQPRIAATSGELFRLSLTRRKGTTGTRHNPERETVLPLYLGLLLHTKTRK